MTKILLAILMVGSASAADLSSYLPFSNDLYASCMTNMKKDCRDWALRGGGGESPRGLSGETTVELAPGEKYILMGIVNIIDNEPYLEINLKKHRWLASAARLREPFYRIEAPAAQWKKYRGREISIVATARYTAWETRSGKLTIEVYLAPAEDPVPAALQRGSF